MAFKRRSGSTQRARRLRREATDAERLLWNAFRETFPDAKFRRQVPFGPYIADFASHRLRLIVEVDGGQHAEAPAYDAARTKFLTGEGYCVLRFWNNEVLENLDGVLDRIVSQLHHPHPHPPTLRAGPSLSHEGRRV